METVLEVVPGQTIITQGEQGDGFYILEKGSLEVYKDDVLLAVLMYPGTIFGEMSDILGKPRSCTVRAKNDAVVRHIQEGGLEELVRENPAVTAKMLRTLALRLERTTQKLVEASQRNTLWHTR